MDTNQEILNLRIKITDLEQRFQSDLADHWKMMSDILVELNQLSDKVRAKKKNQGFDKTNDM